MPIPIRLNVPSRIRQHLRWVNSIWQEFSSVQEYIDGLSTRHKAKLKKDVKELRLVGKTRNTFTNAMRRAAEAELTARQARQRRETSGGSK